MAWHQSLKKWSQSSYGIIHALAIAGDIQMGNLSSIGSNVAKSMTWLSSHIGFPSVIQDKGYRPNSIKLDNRSAEEVIVWLRRSVAEMLIVDLASLCDELLQDIMTTKGIPFSGTRYFIQRVTLISVWPNEEWAKTAMLELNALRNCIIHSDSRWNEQNAKEIEGIHGVKPLVGEAIEIGFREVINFKRAVRVFLGAASR